MKSSSHFYMAVVVFSGTLGTTSLRSQTVPAIGWKNQAGLNAVTTLNAGSTFTTNFRGTNDVSITELLGQVNSVYRDDLGGTSPGNNPVALKTFMGSAVLNNGDGIAGHMKLLETAVSANAPENSLRFDFTIPLDRESRIVIADVDLSEVYTIQAYQFYGGSYHLISTAGWTATNFTGQMAMIPDATWPTWDGNAGTLTGNSPNPMNEPFTWLAPDQAVDRLVFTKRFQSLAGSAGIQVIQVPEPSALALVFFAGVSSIIRRRR